MWLLPGSTCCSRLCWNIGILIQLAPRRPRLQPTQLLPKNLFAFPLWQLTACSKLYFTQQRAHATRVYKGLKPVRSWCCV